MPRTLGVPKTFPQTKKENSDEKLNFRNEVSKIHTTVQKGERNVMFSATQERFNDAGIAKWFNTISTTVNDAMDARQWETPWVLCERERQDYSSGAAQCEILGTQYCTDCCRINEQQHLKHEKIPKLYNIPEGYVQGHIQTYRAMEVFQRVYKYHRNCVISEKTEIQTTDLPNRLPKSLYTSKTE